MTFTFSDSPLFTTLRTFGLAVYTLKLALRDLSRVIIKDAWTLSNSRKMFPVGVAEADCWLSHMRVVWRVENGQLEHSIRLRSRSSAFLAFDLGAVDEQFLQNLLGLAYNASLDSSKATVNATLLCKDAKFAEDAKKILDGGQVVMRNTLKGMRGVPRELSDMVDAIKFSVSGAKVKGSLQTSLEPLSKWIKEQADKFEPGVPKKPRAKSTAAPRAE